MVKYLDRNSGFNQWAAKQNADKKRSGFMGWIWWFVLFLLSWWLLNLWLAPRPNTTDVAKDVAPAIDMSAVPEMILDGEKISVNIQGLRISDVALRDFATTPNDATPITLLSTSDNFIEVGFTATGTVAPVANTVWENRENALVWRNGDGVEFRREIAVSDYIISVTDTINNGTGRDISIAPYTHIIYDNDTHSSAGVYTGAITFANNDIERDDWRDLSKKSYAYTTTNGFVGFTEQYWEIIASISAPDQTMRVQSENTHFGADVSARQINIVPGDTKSITTNLYVGPRDQATLNTASNVIPGLGKTMDYGWFWFLAMPLLWVLNVFNSIVMNYGLAIIILTILLRILIWPLTRKSYTSMIAMQRMQPEMQKLQKLYANDKMRLQMEMMKLYQSNKTSPMSGCLPMLLQIPIFFALYKALLISVPMRNATFLWISDLASMDPYFILPILMGVSMWLQQKLQTSGVSANGNDTVAQTQRVIRWMPVLFTVMFAWMPAGLVLYWTVSNLFGIIQMQIIKRRN